MHLNNPGRKYLVSTCIFLLILQGACLAQSQTIDSLKQLLPQVTDQTEKLKVLFLLGEQRHSLHPDTLYKYASEAKILSIQLNNDSYHSKADYYLANYFIKTGKLDTALQLCNNNLPKLATNPADKKWWLRFGALQAQILVKQNNFKEALAGYYAVLKAAEKFSDIESILISKNGIGWVNMEMSRSALALRWFYKALQSTGDLQLLSRNANIYSNIAAIYNDLKRYDSSELYAKTAIRFARSTGNLFYLANSLNILSNAYINTNRSQLAEGLLKEGVDIRRQIGDPFYIVSDISQLAQFYASNNQSQKGIELSNEGVALAKKYGLTSKLPYLYFALAQNYRSAGDYRQYGETMEKVAALKDTVYAANSAEAMTEMEAKYDLQKQENIIIKQKLDLVSKNYQLFGSLILFILLLTVAVLLFTNYRARQKVILISIQEEEKRKAHEAVLLAQENERKRIAADLHDNMGAYATAISSNIDMLLMKNADADFELMDSIKRNATEIMGSLRDTIWILHSHSILLTAVSDRFKNYVNKLSKSYKQVSIEVKEEIDNNLVLSPEIALNTLRIMQEALNNALKHSNGNLIVVQIISLDKFKISIADNGSGIMVNGSKHDTYGLKSMQNRAKANGWQLSINKIIHSGTEVVLHA